MGISFIEYTKKVDKNKFIENILILYSEDVLEVNEIANNTRALNSLKTQKITRNAKAKMMTLLINIL